MYRGMNLLLEVMFIAIMNLQNIELAKKVHFDFSVIREIAKWDFGQLSKFYIQIVKLAYI